MARRMKSKSVVATGQKFPIDFTDPGPLSGGGLFTTTASTIPPLPSSPWQRAQLSANSILPCAAVPPPGGSPIPSGMTVRSQGARSACEIGCPRLGPSASAGNAKSNTAASTKRPAPILRVSISHLTFGIDRPASDGVVVVARKFRPFRRRLSLPAQSNEFGARRLHIAGFVPCATLQHGRPTVPMPGHTEAREGLRQRWFLERSLRPARTAVGGDHDLGNASGTRIGDARDLHVTGSLGAHSGRGAGDE